MFMFCFVSTDEKDAKEILAYNLAVAKGVANPSNFSIHVLGQENSGKTCLVSLLLGEDFTENIANQDAEVSVCTTHASSKWSRIKDSEVSKKLRAKYLCKLQAAANQITIITELASGTDEINTPKDLPGTLYEFPESVMAEVQKAKGAGVKFIEKDGIDTVIWDFEGQSIYFCLQCMFLKQGSIIAIVFDASQDLHSPSKGRDIGQDLYTESCINHETTGCESVCYWLNSIHSICDCKDDKPLHARSNFLPTVVLIASQIDKIGDDEAIEKKRQQIIDQLVKLLAGHQFSQHLAGMGHDLRAALEEFCFFISNKVRNERNKREVDRLKQKLVEVAQYILDEEHPVIYLDIERKLMGQAKPVITKEEFHAIAIDSGFSAGMQSEEFTGMLTHFHNKGTILHFLSNELLQNYIVLSPQWLTKLIAYVIVAHPYTPSGTCHDDQYDRLKKHGILDEDFFDHMTQRFNEDHKQFGLSLKSRKVLSLIKHFKLIAKIDKNARFLEEARCPMLRNDKKEAYIVPSMLPLKFPDNTTLPSPKDKHSSVVHFRFPERFLPLMMFYQLLTDCIERNITKKNKNVRL